MLGFHDCVSGCDGCINLDNAANNGLSDAIDLVEELYTEITDTGMVVRVFIQKCSYMWSPIMTTTTMP